MKNKKTLVWIVVAVALVFSAVGLYVVSTADILGNADIDSGLTSGTDTETITFGLAITVGGEEVIFDEEVTVAEGTALIDAMTENITADGGVVYSESEYGAYITSICGYSENYETNEYWVYTINGESAMVGASEYCPEEGDEVVFDLSPLVW